MAPVLRTSRFDSGSCFASQIERALSGLTRVYCFASAETRLFVIFSTVFVCLAPLFRFLWAFSFDCVLGLAAFEVSSLIGLRIFVF
jgi:hypothetical protein